jgi:hypothetical protein
MRDPEDHSTRELLKLANRLPREIQPPVDMWPAIEAQLLRPSLESLARDLPVDVDPPIDLWPRIESRLTQRRSNGWLAAAAVVFVGVSALLIGIATQNNGIEPIATELELAAQTIRQNLGLVRDERRAIEEAIEQDPASSHLRELWAYTYETELRLENEVMVSYQRGYGI